MLPRFPASPLPRFPVRSVVDPPDPPGAPPGGDACATQNLTVPRRAITPERSWPEGPDQVCCLRGQRPLSKGRPTARPTTPPTRRRGPPAHPNRKTASDERPRSHDPTTPPRESPSPSLPRTRTRTTNTIATLPVLVPKAHRELVRGAAAPASVGPVTRSPGPGWSRHVRRRPS